jgi:hypothetical protein
MRILFVIIASPNPNAKSKLFKNANSELFSLNLEITTTENALFEKWGCAEG